MKKLNLLFITATLLLTFLGVSQLLAQLPAPTLVSPVLGANGKVNVPIDEQTTFMVKQTGQGQIREFEWQDVRSPAPPGDQWNVTSSGQTRIRFTDATEFTVYVRTISVKGDPGFHLAIPVRAWRRPSVLNPPPKTPSWFQDGVYLWS